MVVAQSRAKKRFRQVVSGRGFDGTVHSQGAAWMDGWMDGWTSERVDGVRRERNEGGVLLFMYIYFYLVL